MSLNKKFAVHRGRLHRHVPAAAGAGSRHHRRLQAADRGPHRPRLRALKDGDQGVHGQGHADARARRLFSSFQVNVPQLYADIDRTKARQLGVSVPDVFETLQVYLGSLYVNDFNKFGRTYSVRVQADAQVPGAPRRSRPAQGALDDGRDGAARGGAARQALRRAQSAPCATTASCRPTSTAARRPGFSTGQAQAAVAKRRGGDAAKRLRLRVDRADLSGDPRRQFRRADRVPDRDPAGVPGAGRALREPDAAAVHHHDRADGDCWPP